MADMVERAKRGSSSGASRGDYTDGIPTPGRGRGGLGSPDDNPDGVPGRDESTGGWDGTSPTGGRTNGGWETVPGVGSSSGGYTTPTGAREVVGDSDAASSGSWNRQATTGATQQHSSYNQTSVSSGSTNAASHGAQESAVHVGTHFNLGL